MLDIKTPDDLSRVYILALAVWREARGEDAIGKYLVAQTIENRVRDSRWPDTYQTVITQKLQFSAFNLGNPNARKFPDDRDTEASDVTNVVWAESVEAACTVLAGGLDFSLGANHYFAVYLFAEDRQPSWYDPDKVTMRHGGHVFLKL